MPPRGCKRVPARSGKSCLFGPDFFQRDRPTRTKRTLRTRRPRTYKETSGGGLVNTSMGLNALSACIRGGTLRSIVLHHDRWTPKYLGSSPARAVLATDIPEKLMRFPRASRSTALLSESPPRCSKTGVSFRRAASRMRMNMRYR